MDVNRFNFWQTLPVILEAITLSDYIAVNLETTGASGHSSSKEAVEHTETAAYHLAAEAAKTFQILQFGLTCLSYDRDLKGLSTLTTLCSGEDR
jgi:hypothetical protein